MILLVAAAALSLLPGTFTNEEQVYFAREAGKPVPPWVGVQITSEGDAFRLRSVDAFGVPGTENRLLVVTRRTIEGHDVVSIASGDCRRDYAEVPRGLTIVHSAGECSGPAGITTVTEPGIAMKMADGTVLELQRARPFRCWVSIPKLAPKVGKTEWWFKSGLVLHDRGGRVTATTDEPVAQSFTLRMRNVVWPTGTNAPSLVLYIHGADPDTAIAYSWADPGAKRVGINLRTVQGSCMLVEPT